jgi:hypothetical protein
MMGGRSKGPAAASCWSTRLALLVNEAGAVAIATGASFTSPSERPRRRLDSRKLLIGLSVGVILFGLLDLDRPRTARPHAD